MREVLSAGFSDSVVRRQLLSWLKVEFAEAAPPRGKQVDSRAPSYQAHKVVELCQVAIYSAVLLTGASAMFLPDGTLAPKHQSSLNLLAWLRGMYMSSSGIHIRLQALEP